MNLKRLKQVIIYGWKHAKQAMIIEKKVYFFASKYL